MSVRKKEIRANFRNSCFKRDNYCCVMCGFQSSLGKATDELNVHHVSDRSTMPNQGYVSENGISLCPKCHELAEYFHELGEAYPGYAPDDLYAKIGSSYEIAFKASSNLQT